MFTKHMHRKALEGVEGNIAVSTRMGRAGNRWSEGRRRRGGRGGLHNSTDVSKAGGESGAHNPKKEPLEEAASRSWEKEEGEPHEVAARCETTARSLETDASQVGD